MLVLTRKRTEMIKVGEDVVIHVIHTSRGSVKLGIEAPANVRVLRAELGDRSSDVASMSASTDDEDLAGMTMVNAHDYLSAFDSEFVADLEDRALTYCAS